MPTMAIISDTLIFGAREFVAPEQYQIKFDDWRYIPSIHADPYEIPSLIFDLKKEVGCLLLHSEHVSAGVGHQPLSSGAMLIHYRCGTFVPI